MAIVQNTQIANEKRFQNCVICIFRPVFYFGYTGITAIKFSCDHSRRPVSFSMERSWLSTSLAAFLLFVNIIFGFLNAYTLYDSHMNLKDIIFLLSAIAIHFIAAYLFLTGIFRAQMKINELRGIAELTRDCENAGLIVFDTAFVKMAHYIVYTFIGFFVSMEILTLVIFTLRGDYSLKAFRRLFTDTCIFMQGTISTHFMMLQLILLRLFQRILSEIKTTAEERFNNIELHNNDIEKLSFPARIRYLHRLYQSAYFNFMEIGNFINPMFVVWWNIVVIDNVICVYVILNSIMIKEPLAMEYIFFILLHTGTLGGLITFLIVMGMFAEVVSYLLLIVN